MSKPDPTDIYPSPATFTYSAIAVVNAIKQSIASSVTVQTYTGVALDGTVADGRGPAALNFTQAITATTAAHAGSYTFGAANAITVTGTDADGAVLTDTITLTATNGGETIATAKGFASVTKIVVPAQNDALGSFQFGIGDIVLAKPARQVRGGAGGNIKVGYQAGLPDVLPSLQGERHDVLPVRVYDSGSTALPVTVYK